LSRRIPIRDSKEDMMPGFGKYLQRMLPMSAIANQKPVLPMRQAICSSLSYDRSRPNKTSLVSLCCPDPSRSSSKKPSTLPSGPHL
jgi:hypothetical protein